EAQTAGRRGRFRAAGPGLPAVQFRITGAMATLLNNKDGADRAASAAAPDSRMARHPEKQGRPDTPLQRKPSWIRVKAPTSPGYLETKRIVREGRLHTVCEEAGCPNIGECWTKKHATLMIMGD